MGPIDVRARSARATTTTVLLTVALLLAILPPSTAAAQTADQVPAEATVAFEELQRIRRDAGVPTFTRQAYLQQPAVAWSAWAVGPAADSFALFGNEDIADQVGADEVYDIAVAVAGGDLRATLRQGIREEFGPGGRSHADITDPDLNDIGVGASRLGDTIFVSAAVFARPAGVPAPSGWARPNPLPVSAACPDTPPPGFPDVPADSVHAPGIGCVAARDITQGVRGGGFDPRGSVTRAQMASFLVRLLEDRGVELPARPSSRAYPDTAGSVHEANIERLHVAGIVRGSTDGTYRPGGPVSRQQMATFLVRTYEFAGGSADRDPSQVDYFVDDWITNSRGQNGPGAIHGAAVQRAAEIRVATGRESPVVGFYGMDGDVQRDQMASFLSRLSGAIAQL